MSDLTNSTPDCSRKSTIVSVSQLHSKSNSSTDNLPPGCVIASLNISTDSAEQSITMSPPPFGVVPAYLTHSKSMTSICSLVAANIYKNNNKNDKNDKNDQKNSENKNWVTGEFLIPPSSSKKIKRNVKKIFKKMTKKK